MTQGPSASWASSPGVRRSMQANRRADTKPELQVRAALHRRGLRFRKDLRLDLSGGRVRPDVVFTRWRVACFIDGCYWHRCPIHGTEPKSNAAYWGPKLDRNVQRDREADAILRDAGWVVVRGWEHEDPESIAERVAAAVEDRRTSTGQARPILLSTAPAAPGPLPGPSSTRPRRR
jgi:DNA mismatch endonuclease, patch repair protein